MDSFLFVLIPALSLTYVPVFLGLVLLSWRAYARRLTEAEDGKWGRVRDSLIFIFSPLSVLVALVFLIFGKSLFLALILLTIGMGIPVLLVFIFLISLKWSLLALVNALANASGVVGEKIFKFSSAGLYHVAKAFDDYANWLILSILMVMARQELARMTALRRVLPILGKLSEHPDREALLMYLASDAQLDVETHNQALNLMEEIGMAEALVSLAEDRVVRTDLRVQAATRLERAGFILRAVQVWRHMAAAEEKAENRVEAARNLGYLGEAELAQAVLHELIDDERTAALIKVQAARILGREMPGKIKAIAILDGLIITNRGEPEIVLQAATVLCELDEIEKAAPVLRSVVNNKHASAFQRKAAVRRLGEFQLQAELEGLALDPLLHYQARLLTAEELEKLGAAQAAAQTRLDLAKAANIPGVARVQAARLAGSECLEEAARILTSLGRDSDQEAEIRLQAAQALGHLDKGAEARSIVISLAAKGKVGGLVSQKALKGLRTGFLEGA